MVIIFKTVWFYCRYVQFFDAFQCLVGGYSNSFPIWQGIRDKINLLRVPFPEMNRLSSYIFLLMEFLNVWRPEVGFLRSSFLSKTSYQKYLYTGYIAINLLIYFKPTKDGALNHLSLVLSGDSSSYYERSPHHLSPSKPWRLLLAPL